MKYCVVFELDDDPLGPKEGDPVETIESVKIKNGILRKLPPKMPMNYYNFETYTTGYAKGFNDFHDRLTGEYNNYKPEKEITHDESGSNSSNDR